MGKFNEYSQKATPQDADSLMIYDATSKANKLSPFSGIWNWIVGKLTNAVISNLETQNKSVIGALNELNSKAKILTPNISGKSSFYDLQAGIYYFNTEDYRNFTDRPGGSSGRAIWIYNHTGGDERIGILLCALGGKTMVGQCYGGTSLTWKEL